MRKAHLWWALARLLLCRGQWITNQCAVCSTGLPPSASVNAAGVYFAHHENSKLYIHPDLRLLAAFVLKTIKTSPGGGRGGKGDEVTYQ